MTIEDQMTICNRLKGVTTDITWEDHLCFNVGGKMFLITSSHKKTPSMNRGRVHSALI
jgi:predicted DNA-binding protein (MmcQ/YjbR family)